MKKQEIFFHIGLPKTGTTFLQQNVFPYLKDITFFNCVDYPWSDFPVYLNPFYIKYQPGKNLVSDERICGYGYIKLPYGSMLGRIRTLKKNFPQSNILLVLREPNSLKRSLYKQYIKHSYGTLNYQDWIQQELDQSIFDYESLTSYIQLNFPRSLILSFDDLKKNQDVFIQCICDFLGIGFPEGYKHERVYVSPSDSSIVSIRNINRCRVFPRLVKQGFAYFYRRTI